MQRRGHPLAHYYLLLALAAGAWAIALGGVAYAELFVSDTVGPLDVMSRRTATGVFVITAGWFVAAAAFLLSLYALWSQRTRVAIFSALVSGAYARPSVAFLAYADFLSR
jgi:hypothetical protein